jgi:hypothetical protein
MQAELNLPQPTEIELHVGHDGLWVALQAIGQWANWAHRRAKYKVERGFPFVCGGGIWGYLRRWWEAETMQLMKECGEEKPSCRPRIIRLMEEDKKEEQTNPRAVEKA